ncbi:hypothetical protein BT96DRAFT_999330 [Gymnopus androsaceus JB14]|uniref:HTH CENPB-type domain-containing protein n=1 Tax=Gymnopus androsaceus JB14 TaxID=1447944 RepID=A0A6A4H728_9AGAR|nr:hypothetical protein BT96DRAFT_999330 [Gymnopus androsaceus JB14]
MSRHNFQLSEPQPTSIPNSTSSKTPVSVPHLTTRRSYRWLTIAERKAICERHLSNLDEKYCIIAQDYAVDPKTISNTLRNKEKWLNADVGFREGLAYGPFTNAKLIQKAHDIAASLGIDNFRGTHRWADSFKQRHGIWEGFLVGYHPIEQKRNSFAITGTRSISKHKRKSGNQLSNRYHPSTPTATESHPPDAGGVSETQGKGCDMEESSFHQPRFSLSCIRCISASEGSLHSSSVRYFQPEDLERTQRW